MVGNFSLTDEEEFIDSNNPTRLLQENYDPIEAFPLNFCTEYAVNSITTYDTNERNIKFPSIPDNPPSTDGGGSGEPVETRTETTYSNWVTQKKTSNILSIFKEWHQRSPFNDFYPQRRKYLFFGNRKKAPAGCFPLALAKIMTYFEAPATLEYSTITVNWKGLKTNLNSIDATSAAALLRKISNKCDSWYFYAGTFTFPNNVTSYMRTIGFSNAYSRSYSFERIISMIDNGKPMIIYSIPGINIFQSHSWNIDGYKIKNRTVTTKTYVGSTLKNTSTSTEVCNMVHCDFGWRGKHNGYYVSGVFKLNDVNREKDNSNDPDDKTNYNTLTHIITY